MGQKDINYSQLIGYLERRGISPKDAINIIEATTPEAQKDNAKFNWKMLRFTMYLWERIEQDKKGRLWSKTDTCKEVVNSKNYKMIKIPPIKTLELHKTRMRSFLILKSL